MRKNPFPHVKSRLIWTVCAGYMALFLSLAGARAQDTAHADRRAGSSSSVKISPESLDFGTFAVGATTPPRAATLLNSGSTALAITDIVTSGIDFSQTTTCGQTLAPGASCTIQVTFTPAITGPRIATLQILDSDPASPQSIVLTGTGQ